MVNTDLNLQTGGKKRSRSQRKRNQRRGGSLLLDLGVPASLFAATQYMKKRSRKYSKKSKSRKMKRTRRRR